MTPLRRSSLAALLALLLAGCNPTHRMPPPDEGRGPLPADPAFQEGNRLYLEGEFAGAADRFEHFLAKQPKSSFAADAAYRLALCRTALGEYGLAATALDRAEAARPDPLLAAWVQVGRGDVAFGLNDFVAASRAFDRALANGGEHIERDSVMYRAGISRIRGGDWTKGHRILRVDLPREFPRSRWTALAERVDEADGQFWIHIGEASTDGRAEEMLHLLASKGISGQSRRIASSRVSPGTGGAAASVSVGARTLVRVGPYPSWFAASADLPRVKLAGFDARVAP